MSFLYLKHFELDKSPFQITPDIDFFFSGSRRGGILTALLHVACHEEGIATAVAEVGSGKTLLARLMISRLPADISSVYLANPCFSRDEIISAISRDLGLPNEPATTEENLARLHQELLRRHALGLRVLLVIDEAHAMPLESLEEVRLLSNLETDRHKLVNIMLFGQPELDTLLADRRLRQVRDRVIHRFDLPALPKDEATAYIDHRLRVAGWHGGRLFTSTAMALLLKASHGRARRINLLADKSLLAAYAEGVKQVEKRHVKIACSELHADPTTGYMAGLPKWRTLLSSFALAVPMAFLAVWILGKYQAGSTIQPKRVDANATLSAPTNQVAVNDRATEPLSIPIPAVTVASAKPATPLPSQHQSEPVAARSVPDAHGNKNLSQTSEIVRRTEELLNDKGLRGFTLQLASLPSMASLAEYVGVASQHFDTSIVYDHNRTYNGKNLVAVYLGQYPTEQAARDALRDLPEPLNVNQPVIRTWVAIRQEPKP